MSPSDKTGEGFADRPELALAALDEGIWDWDLAGHRVYLSPVFRIITGYGPDETVPSRRFFRGLVHPGDWPRVWTAMAAHLKGDASVNEIEYRMRRRDGEIRWIACKCRIVEWSGDGRPLRMIGTVSDISARVEADQERRLLADIIDQLIEGFSLIDSQGVIRYANPTFHTMLGYEVGELIGEPVGKLDAGGMEEAEHVTQVIRATLERQQTWQGELRKRRKDGSEFWTEARISAFQHPRLGPVWGKVQWDITHLKRQLDHVVDAIAEAVLVVGADGRIIRANARVNEVFGYGAEELFGLPVETLIPGRYRQHHTALRDEFAGAPATRMMGSNRELFGLRKDGSEFPVEVGLGPIRMGDRQITIVSVADIGKLRESEKEVLNLSAKLATRLADTTIELRASEQNFRDLAEHLTEVFWLVSPDLGTMYYVSPAYEAMWGRDRASLYREPLSWIEAVHADDQARVLAYIQAKRAGGAPLPDALEFRVARGDGTERWVKGRGYAVRDGAGDIYRIAGTVEDITEPKLMHERLRASEERHVEAERNKVEEERRRLSLELHDEVGQMLAALNINLEMVARKQAATETEAPLRHAQHIVAELMKTVRGIVYQLRPPQLDDLGLAAALKGHVELLRQNSMITITLKENLGTARLPDLVEMTCFRVVQESLINSLRHASPGRIDVELIRSPQALELSVSDDGVGFNWGGGLAQASPFGHVGLRGMHERVHSLGGELRVESSPAQGCRVRAVIPLDGGHGEGEGARS